jgi:flagellar motor component MotA
VRSASALVAYGGAAPGVVQAGHSLREPERLIDVIGQLVALAWVATMVATFLATVAVAWVGP